MWPLVLSELWAPKGKIFHEVHWWFLGDLVGSFPGLMTTVMCSLLPPFFHERHGLWETLLLGSSHSSCAWKVEIGPNDLTWLSFDHVTCMTPWVLISGNISYFQITCLSVHSLWPLLSQMEYICHCSLSNKAGLSLQFGDWCMDIIVREISSMFCHCQPQHAEERGRNSYLMT